VAIAGGTTVATRMTPVMTKIGAMLRYGKVSRRHWQ